MSKLSFAIVYKVASASGKGSCISKSLFLPSGKGFRSKHFYPLHLMDSLRGVSRMPEVAEKRRR